jgi:hypothetical protein
MTRALSKKAIEDKILDGIVRASDKFTKMSGMASFCDAPEYFLTVSVAESLARDGKNYVKLEDAIAETTKNAVGGSRGRPRKGLRRGGRLDIVLSHKTKLSNHDKDSLAPRAVIEIKHPLCNSSPAFKKDIERLRDLLKFRNMQSKNSIQFCCLAFWTGADKNRRNPDPAKAIKKMLSNLEGKARTIVQNNSIKIRTRTRPHKNEEYCGACGPGASVLNIGKRNSQLTYGPVRGVLIRYHTVTVMPHSPQIHTSRFSRTRCLL